MSESLADTENSTSGTLVYRACESKVVTWPFVRGMLDVSGQLPHKSWDVLYSFPSVVEEVALRK